MNELDVTNPAQSHNFKEALSIAPMIDWSNTHFRHLMRLLAPKALLYTEMQTIGAVLNNPSRALQFAIMEKPLAVQLGGSEPDALANCAKIAEAAGFDEINLNLGCPSERVQSGSFGACLMAEPTQVAKCIEKMKMQVNIPVTAKTRIGIDHQDSYDYFANFVKILLTAGVDKIIVHARKAWLKGLNPKQNRTIPPLHYDYVYRLKQEIGNIPVVINGNIQIEEIPSHLEQVDGVMLGRLACQNPYAIAKIHHTLYPEYPLLRRHTVLEAYLHYAEEAFIKGSAISTLLKPLFSFAHGLPGAKTWKEHLMGIQREKKWQGFVEALSILKQMESADNLAKICTA